MSRIEAACREFDALAGRVSQWITAQPAVGEESLTDWLLFEASQRLSWVRYLKFTRFAESRETGADWDWWLVGDGINLGLRVQAKKLTPGEDHYRGLAHTNRKGLQAELLLESAKLKNLLPFYSLYHPGVGKGMCGGRMGTTGGVSLAHGSSIYRQFIAAGRARVEADAVLAIANPLACLFCCPMARHSSNPVEGVYHQIESYFSDAIRASANPNFTRPGIHTEMPGHLRSLLGAAAEAPPTWIEGEFPNETRDTSGLVVFDLRGDGG